MLLAQAELVHRGARSVVTTLGPEGAVWTTSDEQGVQASPRVDVRDTTGAGDVFIGHLAARLGWGASLCQAVSLATAAASRSVQAAGTHSSYPDPPRPQRLCTCCRSRHPPPARRLTCSCRTHPRRSGGCTRRPPAHRPLRDQRLRTAGATGSAGHRPRCGLRPARLRVGAAARAGHGRRRGRMGLRRTSSPRTPTSSASWRRTCHRSGSITRTSRAVSRAAGSSCVRARRRRMPMSSCDPGCPGRPKVSRCRHGGRAAIRLRPEAPGRAVRAGRARPGPLAC